MLYGIPQLTVLSVVSFMALMGVYTGDTHLIAPLGAILVTCGVCGLCFCVEKIRGQEPTSEEEVRDLVGEP
jgi:hypothetical protein